MIRVRYHTVESDSVGVQGESDIPQAYAGQWRDKTSIKLPPRRKYPTVLLLAVLSGPFFVQLYTKTQVRIRYFYH